VAPPLTRADAEDSVHDYGWKSLGNDLTPTVSADYRFSGDTEANKVPYSFAPTSHFIVTFSLSFTVVIGATILGFQTHALKFFSLLVPSGCPLGLLPLLVLIEFISYLARNVSLGLRLAANVLSGHMLLNILGGFTYNIMSNGIVYFFLGLLPLLFIIAFSGLEIGIAFIQAQVFVVLSSSYIKDGLDLH